VRLGWIPCVLHLECDPAFAAVPRVIPHGGGAWAGVGARCRVGTSQSSGSSGPASFHRVPRVRFAMVDAAQTFRLGIVRMGFRPQLELSRLQGDSGRHWERVFPRKLPARGGGPGAVVPTKSLMWEGGSRRVRQKARKSLYKELGSTAPVERKVVGGGERACNGVRSRSFKNRARGPGTAMGLQRSEVQILSPRPSPRESAALRAVAEASSRTARRAQ
jgi:hypothetical protein